MARNGNNAQAHHGPSLLFDMFEEFRVPCDGGDVVLLRQCLDILPELRSLKRRCGSVLSLQRSPFICICLPLQS